MRDEFDVTIVEADLFNSTMTGVPTFGLVFLPHELCFVDDRVVDRLYSRISNVHSLVGVRRAALRDALGMGICEGPFTVKELRSIIGRFLRVVVEEVEFRGRVQLRVTSFLYYSGTAKNPSYSDNEYVFMIRTMELL